MHLDLNELDRVGGTDAGGYYDLGPDILLAYPLDGYVQTAEGARASLLEMYRIARVRGRRQATVVLMDRVRAQDSRARRVWRDEADPELICGLALVASSKLGSAIASFFLGLTRPRIRTSMHPSLEEAVAWAASIVTTHGGAIDER